MSFKSPINNLKAVLYSGGQTSSNHALHGALSDLVGHCKNRKSFVYVPFCTDGADIYFRRAIKRYRPFGFNEFMCLPVDKAVSKDMLECALSKDVIYLAGGNTFYFLKHIQQAGLKTHLIEFVKNGGVLAGLSAGAIIMTPHIALAGYPHFECDENEVGLKTLSGLGLVPMEFFPHYEAYPRLDRALKAYSAKGPYPVFACKDGGGLVLEGSSQTFMGSSSLFLSGKKYQL